MKLYLIFIIMTHLRMFASRIFCQLFQKNHPINLVKITHE